MTGRPVKGAGTRVSRLIKAPRAAVYQAFLDADAVASWLAPDNMTGRVHAYDAREGGAFRMSLTYRDPALSPPGKTSRDTDTFAGRFVQLVPGERIVQAVAFESDDAAYAGDMTITWTLCDRTGGTEVTALCENLPPGVRPEDNEEGTRQTLNKLAAFVE